MDSNYAYIPELKTRKGLIIRRPEDMPKSLVTKKIDDEWKKRLEKEWWASNYKGEPPIFRGSPINPRNYDLIRKILSFGGEEVCMAGREDDLEKIMERGQLWYGNKAMVVKGFPCRCHENACDFWDTNKKYHNIRVCTGYALSNDGIWRQHSWCVERTARATKVIETTVKRVAYFGFVMTEEESTEFYACNVW